MQREILSRERGKNHWVSNTLPGQIVTNPKRNVHCFADAPVKMGQGKIKVGHIISTREAGKEVACAHSKSD